MNLTSLVRMFAAGEPGSLVGTSRASRRIIHQQTLMVLLGGVPEQP
jgi:hypothetical protein